jgi:hypothetical protein
VVQVALALVLLIGSGLMARSFWELRNVHPGFEEDGLLTMRLSLPRANYTEAQDAAAFYQRLMAELASLPGVTRVGAISNLPMTDSQSNNGSVLEDFPLQPDELPPIRAHQLCDAGLFRDAIDRSSGRASFRAARSRAANRGRDCEREFCRAVLAGGKRHREARHTRAPE